ncbi:mucin-5AC-like isoform X2 [Eleginops maclovinus]|uniref:mucin-5AC-like isoform X2 n=1 Tax=Eleginops maclovinus TaxID=56733 RepID=UPI0030804D68
MNLLVGVTLGLLAVVHSTPVNTLTQIPGIAENEVIREALTDGYLVEQSLLPTLTTESPKRNTTVQHIIEDIQERVKGESIDSSIDPDHFTTTSHAEISTDSDSTTTPNPQLSLTSSTEPNEANSGVTDNHIPVSQTTDPTTAFSHAFLSTQSPESGSGDGEMFSKYATSTSSMTSGSGDGEMFTQYHTTTSSMTSGSGDGEMFTQYHTTTSSTTSGSGDGEMFTQYLTTISSPSTSMTAPITPGMFAESEASGQKLDAPDTFPNGHQTPDWIIIVGFIVGLAALVMLFAAIATRHKWNGPSQASQVETKTNYSNQQREIEMETFIHKDNPRENGTAEYTVIPLDELPDHSSH